LDYWRRELAGDLPVLALRIGRQRPPVLTFRGASRPFALASEELAALKELALRAGVTPFMALLAAYAVTLLRAGGQAEVGIGAAVATRTRAEVEPLIGFFVNVLPLRIGLAPEETWRQVIERVRRLCLAAYDHQDAPFEMVVKALAGKRALGHTPV